MRILFVCPRFPWPLNSGSNQRSYALLRALSTKHEVVLASPSNPGGDTPVDTLRPLIERYVSIPDCWITQRHARPPEKRGRIGDVLEYLGDLLRTSQPYCLRAPITCAPTAAGIDFRQFDAVFCRYMDTAALLPAIPWNRVVLDADDLCYRQVWQDIPARFRGRTVILALETLRTFLAEQRIVRRVARTLVCSEADQARIRSHRTSVLRNGVTLPAREVFSIVPRGQAVVFVGTMNYRLNNEGLVWFLQHVWPEVLRDVQEAELFVVGSGDPATLAHFRGFPRVRAVGEVKETATWFRKGVLSVVPLLKGAGTRIKIVESLACGRPVVATTVGAAGLEFLREEHGVARSDEPSSMAKRIAEILLDPNEWLRAAEVGRRLVESHLSWEVVTAGLADKIERWVAIDGR